MNKWAPIAPNKPGQPSTSRFTSVLKPQKPGHKPQVVGAALVGPWPESVLTHIITFLPVPDLPQVARVNRAFARLVRDDSGWEKRARLLGLSPHRSKPLIKSPQKPSSGAQQDDEFGDFSTSTDVFEDIDFGDSRTDQKSGNDLLDFADLPLPSKPSGQKATGFFALTPPASIGPGPYLLAYRNHHLSLLPSCHHLRSSPSPSSTLALLFPPSPTTALPPSLAEQSNGLLTLLLFLSPRLQPLRDWGFLRQALLSAADRFDSSCLMAFEVADSKQDEAGMRLAAESSWKVWDAGGGRREQWECGRVWVEKREVFYETSKWDPLENIVKAQSPSGGTVRQLDFTPMDAFMSHVLETFRLDAQLAVRVFPLSARVVLSFCERVANDVIGEYLQSLLSQARIVSQDLFLQATAATFVQAWKLVDVAMEVLGDQQTFIPRTKIEDVVYRMFEVNMDEYLEEETEAVKRQLDSVCQAWDQQVMQLAGSEKPAQSSKPTFLSASNPDQVKRNVLAGFRDALLLPVTIVPRTVTLGVNAIVTGGSQAVNGLSMLNPQKWGGANGRPQLVKQEDGEVLMETSVAEDVNASETTEEVLPPPSSQPNGKDSSPTIASTDRKAFDRMQLLVSLDTALELIHADRDSLKRAETFAKYPGKCGHRVRETLEEIFILLLKATGDRHIAPGFKIATNQMRSYRPAEHSETTSVAPLLQFFELVHVGDTVQSMVQVYFDKELAQYVDRTDFLNAVMREKKRFEAVLDDAVAAGLNAGIEVLMNQVEHIILVKTGPREYYPVEGTHMELKPTEGCREAIACLEMHCNLLKGSTSKEVLEVFYQEVGIRLQAILQRHLKRQIISLEGGFQIIADLNAYHAFVASLKQQRITEDFSNLKMLGHVYIVSDAKDLAQIVRDVTRYGGTFRPEDIYEFIQRRSDWKKIEKTVDKAMYALSVKEDCVIM
ncbi:recyclin-1 [Tremella mesenterica]|uniref:Recyclin-1 n=1 Tax=Tremella mesenterica TaxID=5217 RepID=A0A4Q1BC89_TREME|nr:uncharacterized protein TREMEDRAFT_24527 [Tremella mesenterica DSM 1558]EIW71948.1 hypothetical protein TREMEDRAFT_24527 [Tremella mesenterica DSM 1558]RXK35647.1 recyclin-1 [Tremella mesenterica]